MNDGGTIEEPIPEDDLPVDPTPVDPIPEDDDWIPEIDDPKEDAPIDISPPEGSPVEDNWEIEITVIAKNTNQVTQVSNIKSENRVTINDIVTDSELLRILNFIQPKP